MILEYQKKGMFFVWLLILPRRITLPSKDVKMDEMCVEMIGEVQKGLDSGKMPAKTDVLDCTGGVYFMKSCSGMHVAVFKPSDEEQGTPYNNKGHSGNEEMGSGLRPYFKPGQGYLRETAVYLLDEGNFCQVPPTTIVHCQHSAFHYPSESNKVSPHLFPKLGSLQKFIRTSETFENIGTSLISTFELQKIALLDIRILNCDRNASNILAIRKVLPTSLRARSDSRSHSICSAFEDQSDCEMLVFPSSDDENSSHSRRSNSTSTADSFELIPIDHGYCLPTRLKIDDFDWAWFNCSQVHKPIDPKIKEYILSIDIEKQISKLTSQLNMPDDSLFLIRVAHQLLVEGIQRGLTLRDIATVIVRMEDDVPSTLERLIREAEENAHRSIESRSGRLDARQASDDWTTTDRMTSESTSPFSGCSASMKKNTSEKSLKSVMTKSAKITFSSSTSSNSPLMRKKSSFKGRTCAESEPILESRAEVERDSNEEGGGAPSPVNGKKQRKNMEIRYSSRKFDSIGKKANSVYSPSNSNAAEQDEYFMSDVNDYNSQSGGLDDGNDVTPPIIHSNQFDDSSDNDSGLVKVGLHVPYSSKAFEGLPIKTLRTFDSSAISSLSAGIKKSSLLPSSVRTAADPDLTSSECGSSYDDGSPKAIFNKQPNYSSDTLSALSQSASVTPLPFQTDSSSVSGVTTTTSERTVSFSPISPPVKRFLRLNTTSSKSASECTFPLDSTDKKSSLTGFSPKQFPTLAKISKREQALTVSPSVSLLKKSGGKLEHHFGDCSSGDDGCKGGSSSEEEHRTNDEDEDCFVPKHIHVNSSPDHSIYQHLVNKTFNSNICHGSTINHDDSSNNHEFSIENSLASALFHPIALTRVASLGAFASPPIYDTDKSERQVPRLHHKRLSVAKTQLFQSLRLDFALKAIRSYVARNSVA
mmetsp:Transcript_18597/g.25686  ORF Transcript_18597/g.25686 Transcript_18597/m.25686 type:complete len:927 (+) Transcript_18597:506-3286(+)